MSLQAAAVLEDKLSEHCPEFASPMTPVRDPSCKLSIWKVWKLPKGVSPGKSATAPPLSMPLISSFVTSLTCFELCVWMVPKLLPNADGIIGNESIWDRSAFCTLCSTRSYRSETKTLAVASGAIRTSSNCDDVEVVEWPVQQSCAV